MDGNKAWKQDMETRMETRHLNYISQEVLHRQFSIQSETKCHLSILLTENKTTFGS